jgi:hypothetical protein
MHFSTIIKSHIATNVSFSKEKMTIYLEDGRTLSVPLDWFPILKNATSEQLNNWRFIGSGAGIHWNDLDEDISIEKLLE